MAWLIAGRDRGSAISEELGANFCRTKKDDMLSPSTRRRGNRTSGRASVAQYIHIGFSFLQVDTYVV